MAWTLRSSIASFRTKTDVLAQILQVADGSVPNTKIIYTLFLTYEQLKEYLSILIQNGLVEYREVTQTYKTTEKGLKFLKIYEQIQGELASTTNSNSTINESLNKKSVWPITTGAPIIVMAVLSSFLSVVE